MCIPAWGSAYVIFLGIFEVEVAGGIFGDLLGEFNRHVVSVVGGLDDAANHELGSKSGKHN